MADIRQTEGQKIETWEEGEVKFLQAKAIDVTLLLYKNFVKKNTTKADDDETANMLLTTLLEVYKKGYQEGWDTASDIAIKAITAKQVSDEK